jgi:hypothetical protein
MDLAPKDLSPECAAAARKLAGAVLALPGEGAVRHPAFGGLADGLSRRADELAVAAPPFPRASLRYLARSLADAARAHEEHDLTEAQVAFGTAIRFARSLIRALERYEPRLAPAVCSTCGEPYVGATGAIPVQAPSPYAEERSYDVMSVTGVGYVVEAHNPCPGPDWAG